MTTMNTFTATQAEAEAITTVAALIARADPRAHSVLIDVRGLPVPVGFFVDDAPTIQERIIEYAAMEQELEAAEVGYLRLVSHYERLHRLSVAVKEWRDAISRLDGVAKAEVHVLEVLAQVEAPLE